MKALSLVAAVVVVMGWATTCPAQCPGGCCPRPAPVYAEPSYPSGDAVTSPSDVYQPMIAQRYVYRPVISMEPMPGELQVGQGILGQPKLYVPGQPIRNFLRYFTP